jgi:hypothetical protein
MTIIDYISFLIIGFGMGILIFRFQNYGSIFKDEPEEKVRDLKRERIRRELWGVILKILDEIKKDYPNFTTKTGLYNYLKLLIE